MNHGFFNPVDLVPRVRKLGFSSRCAECGLYKGCNSPRMKYTGKGQKKILIIGEAPGAEEDERNEQFIGRAGKRLDSELRPFKIQIFRDCWKTNAVRCRPPKNETPSSKMIAACRPALFREIEELKPKMILLFGTIAAQSVLGHLWGEDLPMASWYDWVIPYQEYNCWISANYHPSYLERSHDPLLDLLFRKKLKKTLREKGRPWKDGVPDYTSEVEILYKVKEIKSYLTRYSKNNYLFSFDYETNCIKPETDGAEIVSCSFSDGKKTISFPWTNRVSPLVSRLLRSNTPKIAANMKFEERWTWHMLGHRVHNWDWDTMLAAHVLNHNRGVTGLKFQAFVRFGLPPYDRHIEPFLKGSRGVLLNRVREIPMEDLLLYNGLDSLLTHKLAAIQKKETDDDGHSAVGKGRKTNRRTSKRQKTKG